MKKGFFSRLFKRDRREPAPQYDYEEEYYEEEPREMDNESLLIDHHFNFIPEDDFDRHIGSMSYQIMVENTTDYPMGNLKLEFSKKTKLGKFKGVKNDKKMLDPGEKTVFDAPFKPSYIGGSEEFEFNLNFFDFRYKVDERITLTTEPIKVMVPKFRKLEIDEDGFRLLTSDLYRWVVETDVIKVKPEEIFTSLSGRLDKIGFAEANSMVNESMYRGITQVAATDSKGRKWAAQVQVIGDDKESKILLYTFGERPQFPYNLATKILLKADHREEILGSIV
ncbi:MAG: hypothetical protein ACMUIG_01395 [Thermoplasmatota archaeon]